MRQIGGSIGTAVLISVMSNSAKNAAASNPLNALIHGMNSAFIVAAVLALIGFILSFTLKKKPQADKQGQRRADPDAASSIKLACFYMV
jgi:hypothetical protein